MGFPALDAREHTEANGLQVPVSCLQASHIYRRKQTNIDNQAIYQLQQVLINFQGIKEREVDLMMEEW